ncbi:uncharacterized protein LOC135212192 [Macrobrachium nipponense]|uniref:uncharacterized protein LOC135212192 n=1 Tax=Macrobrachium nipponense TaxID=159736 RepID=UPI0030C89A08
MASLDVESLFTNVPIDKQPPNIPEESLKTLLDICTKRAPFTSHGGQMFRQKDGVAMGSPLGVLFANFYMDTIEERVFSQHRCPWTYARYIDDIFVQADSEEEVEALRQQFLRNSTLNFTIKFSSEDRLPFLDVLITMTTPKMTTTVYTKSTNLGLCLNGESECPARFKTTTVRAFVRRALTHCSAWQDTHLELDRASQMMINNGYSIKLINREIRTALNKWYMEDGENKENPPSEDIQEPEDIANRTLVVTGLDEYVYNHSSKELKEEIERCNNYCKVIEVIKKRLTKYAPTVAARSTGIQTVTVPYQSASIVMAAIQQWQ